MFALNLPLGVTQPSTVLFNLFKLISIKEAMDIVSEPNEEHQEVQETNKGRQLENDHIVTETGDTYFTMETNDIAHLEVVSNVLV